MQEYEYSVKAEIKLLTFSSGRESHMCFIFLAHKIQYEKENK